MCHNHKLLNLICVIFDQKYGLKRKKAMKDCSLKQKQAGDVGTKGRLTL